MSREIPAESPDSPRGVDRMAAFLVHRRWVYFPMALVLFAGAWPIAARLTFDRSIESLYSDDNPYLRNYVESKSLFGGDELAIVAYTDPELFDPGTQELSTPAANRLTALATELSKIEGVRAASTQDLASASERKNVRLEILSEEKSFPITLPRSALHELVRGILLGHDDQTTAVVLRLEPQSSASVPRGETINDVRQAAAAFTDRHGLETYVVGEPVQVEEMYRYVEEDGRVLFAWSLGLLAFVLVVLFRSLRWVALPLLIVVVTIRWTEALLVLSGLRLSMVSSMLNSLVTIIGVATVTHVAVHYREHRREADRVPALNQTLARLLPAIFWTCATTAFGFAALLTSHITPVRSFGLMMTVATLLVLAAVGFLLPGGVLLGTWAADPRDPPAEKKLLGALGWISRGIERHPRWLSAGFLGVVTFAAAGFWRLQVETDFSKNFRDDSPIVQALAFFEEPDHFGGAGTWEVNFPAPETLSNEYLDQVEELAARLRSRFVKADHSGELTKVLSLTDAVNHVPRFPVLTNTLEKRLNVLGQLQPELISSLHNPEAGRMRIILRARERQPAERKLELIAEVERISQQWANERLANQFPKPEVKATGLFVLLAFLIESLMGDQLTSFLLAATGIGLMMIVAFQNVRVGLITLVPNLFPIVIVIGGMGWVGLPINIATAMIASVSMGLTVDSSIHYVAGYDHARRQGRSLEEALRETHQGVGRALIFANVALIAGFSVLTLSHFIPLVYFGVLVSVAMLGGLIGNLLLLPLLLRWTSRFERLP